MAVTCLLSHTYNDLRCPVCGEGFLIMASTNDATTRLQARRQVVDVLRAHHTHLGAIDVHPTEPFAIAADNCSPAEWLHPALTFGAEVAGVA